MAVVNIQRGFVFLANPHTASRSTVEGLLNLEGSVEVGHHHCNLQFAIKEYPDTSRCDTIFHGVRNPLDWLVSRFLCNGGQRGDWKTWLSKRPKRPIFDRFIGQTTTYVKFENLASDLARVTGCNVVLKHDREYKTAGRPAHYLDFWDVEQLKWAKRHFSSDFETYHYE